MPRLIPLVLLLVGLAACQPSETESASAESASTSARAVADPGAIRAEIEALTASYQAAERAGNAAAVAAFYTDDAVLHPANKPAVRGRAEIDAYMAADITGPTDVTFTTVDVVASESGELAYERGTIARATGVAGKYLTVYHRTPNGWKIAVDSWSDDAPPVAPAK